MENIENDQNIPGQGKHREFGNFAKTQEIVFAQVINFLVLKYLDIVIFVAKLLEFFKSVSLMKFLKLARGKFPIGQGKHREFVNRI